MPPMQEDIVVCPRCESRIKINVLSGEPEYVMGMSPGGEPMLIPVQGSAKEKLEISEEERRRAGGLKPVFGIGKFLVLESEKIAQIARTRQSQAHSRHQGQRHIRIHTSTLVSTLESGKNPAGTIFTFDERSGLGTILGNHPRPIPLDLLAHTQ
jgi:hypothetical protein